MERRSSRSANEVCLAFENVEPDHEDSESDGDVDHVENESRCDSEEDVDDPNDPAFVMSETNPEDETIDEADMQREVQLSSAKKRKTTGAGRPSTVIRAPAMKWAKDPPEARGKRKSGKQTTPNLPGARGAAMDVSSPIEAWSLLLTDDMLASIVLYTNESIAYSIEKMTNAAAQKNRTFIRQTYHNNTDYLEIKGFIGLLYYAGIFKVSMTDVKFLWEPESISLFRAAMPRHRFIFLLANVRFDDRNTRAQRKLVDNFAPIRELWDEFIANCRRYYTPSENVTIDEQLLSFRGHCSFRIYMKSKPDRYGLKIVMLNDSKTFYMLNAIPYVGKVTTEGRESVPSYYVRVLSEPIHRTNRTVTCDNWFMSVPLVDRMKKEDYKLKMVGTIRKNKREIPLNFKTGKDVGTTLFGYHDGKTLVSYTPKKNKIVLLLSSLHSRGKIDTETGKPEIILFYNSTKGGTDTFDQLCHTYTTCRRTRRWPMRIFYGMLDQAGINSMVLYNFNQRNSVLARREFLRQLALELTKGLLIRRSTIETLQTPLRMCIEGIVGPPEENPRDLPATNKLPKKKNCFMCPSYKSRKTQYMCMRCRKPMCAEHTSKLCCTCAPVV